MKSEGISLAVLVGVSLATLGLGFGLGSLRDGEGEAPAEDAPVKAEVEGEADPKPTKPEPEVPARAQDPATIALCQEAELELAFLKARRDAERDRDEDIRRDFSEGTTVEEALAWAELAESVVESCLPEGLELRFVECTEYPCAAAFAGPEAVQDTAASDELVYTASVGLEACAPLRAAFGEDYPIEAATFLPFPVSCPSGEDEQAFVLMLLDPSGEAFADFHADPTDRKEVARINRWTYRRAHDVDRKWICAGEEPAPDPE